MANGSTTAAWALHCRASCLVFYQNLFRTTAALALGLRLRKLRGRGIAIDSWD